MNNHYINKAIDLVAAASSELSRRKVSADAGTVALIAQIQWAVESLKPEASAPPAAPVQPKESSR